MRFREYLDQHATPEWKRTYLDYRACARQIRAISARLNGKAIPDDEDDASDGNKCDVGPTRPRKHPVRPRPNASERGLRRRTVVGSVPRLSLPASVISFTTWMPSSSADKLTNGSSTRITTKEAPRRSVTSVGGVTEASPLPSRTRLDDSHRRSYLSTVSGSGSGSGIEEMRDEDHPKDDDKDSFMGTGSVRNRASQTKLPRDSTPQDVDDLFSPSSSANSLAPPAMTPPHLACVLPPPPEMRIKSETKDASTETPSKWPMSPTLQRFGTQLSHLSPLRKERTHPRTPSPMGGSALPTSAQSEKSKPFPETTGDSAASAETASPPKTLDELYDCLEPDEYAFFKLLDKELKKVAGFFEQREADCKLKFCELRDQLKEQLKHREKVEKRESQWENRMHTFVEATTRMLGIDYTPEEPPKVRIGEHGEKLPPRTEEKPNGEEGLQHAQQCLLEEMNDEEFNPFHTDKSVEKKRQMRKALNEYYYNLELLKNYRIVNLTGFHKTLRMFEKVTNIGCLKLYMDERVAPCRLSHGEGVDKLLSQTEELYAEHFSDGDIEAARRNLRGGERPDTYYDNVYRAAFMVGLGLPAAVMGIVKFFDDDLRKKVPAYEALMVIYSAFYLPVIFVLLFQLNLDAWVKMRINYEFVMELSRPSLDHRCFHEIPAFLFLTLSYCFFFTFYPIAPNSVSPTTWPIAWLVFVCIFFLNPMPVCHSKARWWFLRVLGHVITPGVSSVRFVVFFIADILNSHTYTIQNIYLLGCVSANNWPSNAFEVCRSSDWTFALLGSLAPLARLLQCLKRFWDTRLPIHLLNAAKYSVSIITTCLNVWNRSRGFMHDKHSFIPWVIFATLNSAFTCSWDFVVDWSLLRPGYKCLRPDLGYPCKWMYYLAMAFNVLVRFVWVFSLPKPGKLPRLRGWINALMEIIRRWIWNFFRVETEHLGNSDSYRACKDVPVPQRKLMAAEEGQQRTGQPGVVRKELGKLGDKLVGTEAGRGPDALNVGARGRAGQREYEARRPGDDPGFFVNTGGGDFIDGGGGGDA